MKIDIKLLKKPEETAIMLHLSNKKHDFNHLEWWLPTIQQSNITFSVLVRDINSFKEIKDKYPNLQVLFAKSPVNVETVVNNQLNLKAVLYPANTAKNLHLLRFNNLQHIYIGSKNSDWLGKIDKTYRAYDEIWVSGNSQYDKLLHTLKDLRHLKIYKVGKPQLKNIFLNKEDHRGSFYLYSLKPSLFSSFYKMPIHTKKDYILEKNIISYSSKRNHLFSILKQLLLNNKNIITENVIITDLPKLKIWLMVFNKPVFVYVPKRKEYIHDKIPKNTVTVFRTYEELKNGLREDKRKNEREAFIEDTFGKSFTLKDEFLNNLKRITS